MVTGLVIVNTEINPKTFIRRFGGSEVIITYHITYVLLVYQTVKFLYHRVYKSGDKVINLYHIN